MQNSSKYSSSTSNATTRLFEIFLMDEGEFIFFRVPHFTINSIFNVFYVIVFSCIFNTIRKINNKLENFSSSGQGIEASMFDCKTFTSPLPATESWKVFHPTQKGDACRVDQNFVMQEMRNANVSWLISLL